MSTAGRITVASFILLVAGLLAAPLYRPELRRATTWQHTASPGKLSSSHAFLENNCAACHTPVKGAEAAKCIGCHATDEWLLKRQPTAFHASVTSCRECHSEHEGARAQTPVMNHEALGKIGLRLLQADPAAAATRTKLLAWIRNGAADGGASHVEPRMSATESALNCATCHATKDRHRSFFGEDCAECHKTTSWSIAEFRHPSPRSTDCAQCHLAPPSHYMEHFQMISARIARQEHAKVNECFLCHQTTAWNDIRGVGYYKHH